MSFTVADIPVQMSDTFGVVLEQLRGIEPASADLTKAQIDSLTSMAEESVARTHRFLDTILDFDLRWRTAAFRRETEYDPAIEEHIEVSLKSWLDMTESFLSQLESARRRGFHPASLDTLRPRIVEVRSMLTPDDEFFRGEELDDLARAAIDEDEAGRTVAFEVMGE